MKIISVTSEIRWGRTVRIAECCCRCGNIVRMPYYLVTKRKGCVVCSKPNLKHGKAKDTFQDPTYSTWENMKARCLNPKNPYYSKYGGRGIGIDPKWMTFEVFLSDMGERPSLKYSLDRINNNLGYSKQNCRWATKEEQQNNRGCVKLYSCDGRVGSMSQWAKWLGVHATTILYHIRKGKDINEIVNILTTKNANRDSQGLEFSRRTAPLAGS